MPDQPINLFALDPDRNGAYTVWLDTEGKWHASGHWYAFLTKEAVYSDAAQIARWPEVIASFAVKETSRYRAIRKAKAMFNARSLGGG